MSNPYAWNHVSIDLVYGRTRLMNELLSGLPRVPAISFALTGGRRMGKTTILRAVENDLKTYRSQWDEQNLAVIPVYIDGLTLPRPIEADILWGKILEELARNLLSTTTLAGGSKSFDRFVEEARALVNQSEKAVRIVILFDEIEPVVSTSWCDGYFANWRALLTNIPGLSSSFAAVFSGAQELLRLKQDVGSPLMDVLELRSLKNLGFEDAKQLMEEPTSVKWDEPFCQFVFEETGGQPMLLQYIMQGVCGREPSTPNIEAARNAVSSFTQNRAWQFSDWWYKYCSPTAQSVYRRLPEDGTMAKLSDLVSEFGTRAANDGLELLEHVGIVMSDDDRLRFRRSGQMFSRWQKVHGSVNLSVAHDQEIYKRLSAVDKDYADKYASSWRILEADLPNYSGAVGEMRDTITRVLHHFAPDGAVTSEPGFQFEQGQNKPSRRQRARYIASAKYLSREQAKALVGDIEDLEFHCDYVAKAVVQAYGVASGLTHTTSTRQLAYQSLKQGDSILAQLLG